MTQSVIGRTDADCAAVDAKRNPFAELQDEFGEIR